MIPTIGELKRLIEAKTRTLEATVRHRRPLDVDVPARNYLTSFSAAFSEFASCLPSMS